MPLVAVQQGKVLLSPLAKQQLLQRSSSHTSRRAFVSSIARNHSRSYENFDSLQTSELVATLDADLGSDYEAVCLEQLYQTAQRNGAPTGVRDVRVTSYGSGSLHLHGPPRMLQHLARAAAALQCIVHVEEWRRPRQTTVFSAPYATERLLWPGPSDVGLNPPVTPPPAISLHGRGITGSGVTIAIGDTGLWTPHCRYASGVTQRTCQLHAGSGASCTCLDSHSDEHTAPVTYVRFSCEGASWCANYATDFAAQYRDHGTHVASLALGAAPDARLVVTDLHNSAMHEPRAIVPPPNIYDRLLGLPYYCEGARVFSYSWAASYSGLYSSMDRTFDHFAWDHPHAVVLAAAGNDGESGATTIGSPSSAKNVISVGALVGSRLFYEQTHGESSNLHFSRYWKGPGRQRFEHPVTTGYAVGSVFDRDAELAGSARGTMVWSSRGPTADGRRKPDVATVGSSLLGDHAAETTVGSCNIDDTGDGMQGTSMATPALSGVAALIVQMFDSCSDRRGCELNASFVQPVPASHRRGEAPSSLVRAVMACATAQANALVNSLGYWSPSGTYMRRLYAMQDANSLQHAALGAGLGEVMLGRALLPSAQHVNRKVFVHGERATTAFLPLSRSHSSAAEGFDLSLAASVWNGDQEGRAFCFATTSASAKVTAALAWNDYPSVPGCNPCLETDLALGIFDSTGYSGGATADTSNNLERVVRVVEGLGSIVKVMIFAVRVSPAVDMQRFSVAVAGNLEPLPECEACILGSELVPCVSEHGFGQNACGNDTETQECSLYSTCFAVTAHLVPRPGVSIFECERGDSSCLPIMFPSPSQDQCVSYTCDPANPPRVLQHGSGQHSCGPTGHHLCVNTTQGRTVVSAFCVMGAARVIDDDEETNNGFMDGQTILLAITALAVAALCTQL